MIHGLHIFIFNQQLTHKSWKDIWMMQSQVQNFGDAKSNQSLRLNDAKSSLKRRPRRRVERWTLNDKTVRVASRPNFQKQIVTSPILSTSSSSSTSTAALQTYSYLPPFLFYFIYYLLSRNRVANRFQIPDTSHIPVARCGQHIKIPVARGKFMGWHGWEGGMGRCAYSPRRYISFT